MADRLITVTSGFGADFKKEEMLESEYQKQISKTAEAEPSDEKQTGKTNKKETDKKETGKE